jgi:DnaJ-domain-containing protein 1
MCHYCFELLEHKLRFGGRTDKVKMADLRDSSGFGLQVRWWKKPASDSDSDDDDDESTDQSKWASVGTVVSGSLKRATPLDVALRDMAVRSSEGIELRDMKRDLYCQVSLIKKPSWTRVTESLRQWTLGRDGLMLEWLGDDVKTKKEATRKNGGGDAKDRKRLRQFMMPNRPVRERWGVDETLRYLLGKAGGQSALDVLDAAGGDVDALKDRVKLCRFRVSERTASVDDYRTWRRNCKRTRRDAKAKRGGKESGRFSAAVMFGIVALLVAGFLALRLNEATYDVSYDDFLENYDIIGVPRETPVNEVRRAYRKLSLKLHPDKVSQCDDACEDRWVRIVEAYQQITDRETGKLKIVRN